MNAKALLALTALLLGVRLCATFAARCSSSTAASSDPEREPKGAVVNMINTRGGRAGLRLGSVDEKGEFESPKDSIKPASTGGSEPHRLETDRDGRGRLVRQEARDQAAQDRRGQAQVDQGATSDEDKIINPAR